ncbi:phosphotransferase [Roseobacter sp.]|uniref:phosphotransferase n=1 Tax=Roseobacter sp. TaxID=1907202 RepID=UPI00329A78FE
MTRVDADLAARVDDLLAQAGRPKHINLRPLSGGKNNKVMRVEQADGGSAILKLYFRDARDPRDRFGAEWRFLSFADAQNIPGAPRPLACDTTAGAALYTELPGTKREPGLVTPRDVAAAMTFIISLNRHVDPADFPPASEACFSLAEHLETVARRVARLLTLNPKVPHAQEAAQFVHNDLTPKWQAVSDTLKKAVTCEDVGALDKVLPMSERILSPSDFGFHNILVSGDTLGFVDFEYAGQDDPAKLLCDFFAVPEVPTPQSEFDACVSRLAIGQGAQFPSRAHLLRDVYQIKWVCIMLNEFLPVGAARRAFSRPLDYAARCAAQLTKARQKLTELDL